jgi:aryl-alcohol dehydrogenase-like predicted oxidoreductase
LTGNFKRAEDYSADDYRRNDPRFQSENFDSNLRIAKRVQELAARKGATPGQVALAWLLSRGPDVVPIPGTKRRQYLEENAAAASLRLDATDLAELDEALPTAGARYAATHMAFVDR